MSYQGSLEHELELGGFDYPTTVRELLAEAETKPLTPREHALVGMSYFRMSAFAEAEHHLTRAVDADGPEAAEAAVELAGAYLGILRPDLAAAVLEKMPPTTSTWVLNMLTRRRGLISTLTGDVAHGAALMEQAWRGFIADDTPRGTGITGHLLGGLLTMRGEYRRSQRYFDRAVEYARQTDQWLLLVDALAKQFIMFTYANNLAQAEHTLRELRAIKGTDKAELPPYFRSTMLMCEIVAARARGSKVAFRLKLLQLKQEWQNKPHPELLLWLGPLILDSVSQAGRHDQAFKMLEQSAPKSDERPLTLRLMEAVVLSRIGGNHRAVELLMDVVDAAEESGQRLDLARAQLHLAHALFKSNQHLRVVTPLTEGIRGMVALGHNFLFRDDLASMRDLLRWAKEQQETRIYVQTLEMEAAEGQQHDLVIQSLGGMSGIWHGEALDFRLDEQEILLMLAYLYKFENCTYTDIARDVFSEKSQSAGQNYGRQAVHLLRQVLGNDAILTIQERPNRPARVRLEGPKVLFDLDDLFAAIEDKDLARVFELYRGRFAARSYGVWVEATVDKIEASLLHAFRKLLASAQPSELPNLHGYAQQFQSVAADNYEVRGLVEQVQQRLQGLDTLDAENASKHVI